MHRSVGEHIQNLERKRDLLSGFAQRTNHGGEEQDEARNQLETELRAVESSRTFVPQWRLSNAFRCT